MTLWRYFDSETSASTYQYHQQQDTMDGDSHSVLSDAESSWCSIQHPHPKALLDSKKEEEPLVFPSLPAQQRVASWLEKYHHIKPSTVHVCYENLSGKVTVTPTGNGRRRARSEVSLADFLRCSKPFRPSFMDRKQKTTMASGKLFSNESRRFHDEFNGGGSWGARTAGDGDAEFLSHAFTHFVAFQSVDFATRHHHHHYDGREMSACVTAVGDECDELDVLEDTAMAEEYPNELDCKQISLWSYFSGILDDLTCDITFIQ